MPMTCTGKMPSEPGGASACDCAIADVLEKITHPVNTRFLETFIHDTIASLRTEFFAATPCVKLELLLEIARAGTHTERLAIFYLLLNIDASLKTRILEMDEGNRVKIGRFLQDLRNEFVTTYFCSGQSTQDFVRACQDGYCIA
jgi:hypothetical protein